MSGKHIIITGASSGIGQYLAKMFVRNGANVTGISRTAPRSNNEISGNVKNVEGVPHHLIADVTDADAMETAFDTAESRFGRCDTLINNAGLMEYPGRKSSQKDSREIFQRVLDINTVSIAALSELMASRMAKAGTRGSIINVTSALRGPKFSRTAEYCASKAACEEFSNHLAKKWARKNVRINCVAPGWFETQMTSKYFEKGASSVLIDSIPIKTIGRFEQLDGVFLLLASEASSYIAGTVLQVDGGFSI
ncbi:MAG: SDR family oxidoreductase [Pseudomonadota bacterium]